MEKDMSGWIKLHRDIQTHWVWDNPDYLKAWLDMCMMANHKARKELINDNVVNIPRGSFDASYRFLETRWKWSRNRVRRFIDALKTDTMVDTATDTGQTVITICKYGTYQDHDNKTDTLTDTPTDTPTDTVTDTNTIRKELKELNKKQPPYSPPKGNGVLQWPYTQKSVQDSSLLFMLWVGEDKLMGQVPTPFERKILVNALSYQSVDKWEKYLDIRAKNRSRGKFYHKSMKAFFEGGFREVVEEKTIEDKFTKFPSGLYKAFCSKCGRRHMPSDKYHLMKGSECCHVEFVPKWKYESFKGD
jgi:hypothetical protein